MFKSYRTLLKYSQLRLFNATPLKMRHLTKIGGFALTDAV